jgi:isocitrate dehydrogenase
MQSTEKSKNFLRSVDGGLGRKEIRIIQPAGEPDIPHAVSFLARILAELRTPARADVAPGPAVDGGCEAAFALEADATTRVQGAGISVTRVRSFDPFVKASVCGMDLAVVRPACKRVEAGVMDANRLSLLNAGLDIDEDTVDAACRYALKFGRDTVQVLLASGVASERPVAELLDRLSVRYPDLDIDRSRSVDCLHRLLSGYADPDVVVASRATADMLIEAALSVSGAESLATETTIADTFVRIAPHVPPRCDNLPVALSERPSTSILAAADLLVWTGRPGDALRLVNAWNRTVEHGSHTAEFNVLSPASYLLTNGELAAAVIDRLDDKPHVLDTDHMGAPRTTRLATSRPALRLVN